MDSLQMSLLFDYYGSLLTDKQQKCFDMRYNQDLSLGEIAQELGVSRQAVCDNLNRTEALLLKTEAKVGYVDKDLRLRRAMTQLQTLAAPLSGHSDAQVAELAGQVLMLVADFEE